MTNGPTTEALTWEMLFKREEDLSSTEKALVAEFNELQLKRANMLEAANKELMKNCKIVCSGQCKHLIPEFGWIEPIRDMAYKIEALNIMYKKYRVYANFEQTKEKYSDFRGYYAISTYERFIVRSILWLPRMLGKLLGRFHYGEKTVIVQPGFTQEIWSNHDSEDSNPHSEHDIVEVGGSRLLEMHKISMPPKWKKVAERHKFLWCINNLNDKLINLIKNKLYFLYKLTSEEEVIREHFLKAADKLVNECEFECRKHCIQCGHTIGVNGNEVYSTHGWYTLVCRECAKLSNGGIDSCSNETKMENRKKLKLLGHRMKTILDEAGISTELVTSGSCSQKSLDKLAAIASDEELDMALAAKSL